MNFNRTRFAIGEVVRIVGDYNQGCECFVQEVVREPSVFQEGIYCLFGLTQVNPSHKHDKNFPNNDSDWFFGDYPASSLESVGRVLSREELIQYRKERRFGEVFADEIDFVISNLGVTKKCTKNREPVVPDKKKQLDDKLAEKLR